VTGAADRIEVHGPSAEETVRVFRAVVASVGARLDMTIEQLDEWKIVVDEAATLLLRATATGGLTLVIDPAVDVVRIVVRAGAVEGDWPGDRVRGWPWRVIRQLATEASCRLGAAGPEIAFSLPLRVPAG
jgi:hypothetical protein